MSNKPLLLLQWLQDGEYKETRSALAKYSGGVNIEPADVTTKVDAVGAIRNWLSENSNTQYMFIGTHGIRDENKNCIGLGATGADYLDWHELLNLLRVAESPPVLWLGACKSSEVANAWTRLSLQAPPVSWIVGFTESIYPSEIERVLDQLLRMSSFSDFVFLDEELPKIRELIPGASVDYYYPISDREGRIIYANEGRIREMYAIDIRQYLLNNR